MSDRAATSREPGRPDDGGHDLRGLRVLNPRPAAQAAPLSASLRAAGAEVIDLPLLEIAPLPLSSDGRACLLALDRYDGVLFVSTNAARLGLDAVAGLWPQWPHRLPAFAVGAVTAQVLADAALTVACPQQEDSEGLLALPAMQAVAGQRWLLFRGDDGRELLRETLQARGATVDVLPLYRRVLPDTAAARWASLPAPPDAVLLTSPRVWQHWRQVAGQDALRPLLVTVSERLAGTVRDAGAPAVVNAGGMASEDWLQALSGWRATGTRDIQ